jgi:hypothetical protein
LPRVFLTLSPTEKTGNKKSAFETLKTKMNVRIKEAFGNFEILLFYLRFTLMLAVMSKKQLEFLEFHTNIVWSWLNLGGTGMLRRYIRNYNQN